MVFLVAKLIPDLCRFQVRAKRGNISWADQCSSGSDSDSDSSLPHLEEEDEDGYCASSSRSTSTVGSVASVEEYVVECGDYEDNIHEDCDEEVESSVFNAAASIFLSPAPFHSSHLDTVEQDAPNMPHSRSQDNQKGPSPAQRQAKQDPFYKTRLCRNFMEGSCRYGNVCNFAHGEDDLRAEATLLVMSSAAANPASDRASAEGADLFKTRMCKNFEQTGYCKFNNKCHFAHGMAELRKAKKSNGSSCVSRAGQLVDSGETKL